MIIANLGDSRAVLGRKTEEGVIEAVQLTTDLKPGLPCKTSFRSIDMRHLYLSSKLCLIVKCLMHTAEAERIRNCDGRVLALKEEPHIQRVWLPHEDVPGLAMSRAFGDFMLKNYGIISKPDVSYHHISPNDQFLVLATDGVSLFTTLY